MSGVKFSGVTILTVILAVQMTGADAQTDPSGSVVEGVVFEDLNNNLIRDEGEPGLSAVPLEFSDGSDRLVQIETGEDGGFRLQLETGLWRVLIQPPSGFEIADATALGFLIEDETVSVRLDIALKNMEVLESETQEGDPTEIDEIIAEATVSPLDNGDDDESENPWGDDTQQEDDGSQGDDEIQGDDGGFYILPESGGSIPSRWSGLLVSIALFTASLILILIGRKLIIDSSHRR